MPISRGGTGTSIQPYTGPSISVAQAQALNRRRQLLVENVPGIVGAPVEFDALLMSNLSDSQLLARANDLTGNTAIRDLTEDLKSMPNAVARAKFSQLHPAQQASLTESGYSTPEAEDQKTTGWLGSWLSGIELPFTTQPKRLIQAAIPGVRTTGGNLRADFGDSTLGGIANAGVAILPPFAAARALGNTLEGALKGMESGERLVAHLYRTSTVYSRHINARVGADVLGIGGALGALGGASHDKQLAGSTSFLDVWGETSDGEEYFLEFAKAAAADSLSTNVANLDQIGSELWLARKLAGGHDAEEILEMMDISPTDNRYESVLLSIFERSHSDRIQAAVAELEKGKVSFGRDVARSYGLDDPDHWANDFTRFVTKDLPAVNIILPDMDAQTFVSGTADAAALVVTDPTNLLGIGWIKYRKATRLAAGTDNVRMMQFNQAVGDAQRWVDDANVAARKVTDAGGEAVEHDIQEVFDAWELADGRSIDDLINEVDELRKLEEGVYTDSRQGLAGFRWRTSKFSPVRALGNRLVKKNARDTNRLVDRIAAVFSEQREVFALRGTFESLVSTSDDVEKIAAAKQAWLLRNAQVNRNVARLIDDKPALQDLWSSMLQTEQLTYGDDLASVAGPGLVPVGTITAPPSIPSLSTPDGVWSYLISIEGRQALINGKAVGLLPSSPLMPRISSMDEMLGVLRRAGKRYFDPADQRHVFRRLRFELLDDPKADKAVVEEFIGDMGQMMEEFIKRTEGLDGKELAAAIGKMSNDPKLVKGLRGDIKKTKAIIKDLDEQIAAMTAGEVPTTQAGVSEFLEKLNKLRVLREDEVQRAATLDEELSGFGMFDELFNYYRPTNTGPLERWLADKGVLGRGLAKTIAVPGTASRHARNFTRSFFFHIPTEGKLELQGGRAIKEFRKLVEFGALSHLPKHLQDEYVGAFAYGSTATRMAASQALVTDVMVRSGLLQNAPNHPVWQQFARLSRQQYGITEKGADSAVIEGARIKAALWVSLRGGGEHSDVVMIPNFRQMAKATREVNLSRHFFSRMSDNKVDAIMQKYWKPMQLMRVGFAVRAGGEETISFLLRNSPMDYVRAKVLQKASPLQPSRTGATVDAELYNQLSIARPFNWMTYQLNYHFGLTDNALLSRARSDVLNTKVGGTLDEPKLAEAVGHRLDELRAEHKNARGVRNGIDTLDRMVTTFNLNSGAFLHKIASNPNWDFSKRTLARRFVEEGPQRPYSLENAEADVEMTGFLFSHPLHQKAIQDVVQGTFDPYKASGDVQNMFRVPVNSGADNGLRHVEMRVVVSDLEDISQGETGRYLFAYSNALERIADDPVGRSGIESLLRYHDDKSLEQFDEMFRNLDLDEILGRSKSQTASTDVAVRSIVEPVTAIAGDQYREVHQLIRDNVPDETLHRLHRLSRNHLDEKPIENFPVWLDDHGVTDSATRDVLTEIFTRAEAGSFNSRIAISLFSPNVIPSQMIFSREQAVHQLEVRLREALSEWKGDRISQESMIAALGPNGKLAGAMAEGKTRLYTPAIDAADWHLLQQVALGRDGETESVIAAIVRHVQEALPEYAQTQTLGSDLNHILSRLVNPTEMKLWTHHAESAASKDGLMSLGFLAHRDPRLVKAMSAALDDVLADMRRLMGEQDNIATHARRQKSYTFHDVGNEVVAGDATGRVREYDGIDASWRHLDSFTASNGRRLDPDNTTTMYQVEDAVGKRWVSEDEIEGVTGEFKIVKTIESPGASEQQGLDILASQMTESMTELFTNKFADTGTEEVWGALTEILDAALIGGDDLVGAHLGDVGHLPDMPKTVWGPRLAVPNDTTFSNVVRFTFDKVTTPFIASIARTPHFIHNARIAHRQTRFVFNAFIDKGLDDALKAAHPDMAAMDRLITTVWDQASYRIEDLQPEHYLHEVFDEAKAIRRLKEAEGTQLVEDGIITGVDDWREALSTLGFPKKVIASEDEVRRLRASLMNRHYAWKEWQSSTVERALNLTAPFIDDHRIRSQWQEWMSSMVPFWFAEEQFLKRWARGFYQTPHQLRKGQLTMNGFREMGVLRRDDNNNEVFVYPFSEEIVDIMMPVLGMRFGGAGYLDGGGFGNAGFAGEMISNPITARTEFMMPGMNSTPGRIQWGPLPAFVVNQLGNRFPEFRKATDAVVGDFEANRFDSGIDREGLIGMFFPASLTNLVRAYVFNNFGEGALRSAEIQALQYLKAAGHAPDPGATTLQLEEFQHRVDSTTRILLGLRAVTGFVAGASGSVHIEEDIELRLDLQELLKEGVDIPDAVTTFLEVHPDATAYTTFASTSASGAPIPASEESLNFMETNSDWIESFPMAAAWFLPQGNDPEFGVEQRRARNWAVANELRLLNTPEEFLRQVYFAEGAEPYFREQEEYRIVRESARLAGHTQSVQRLDRIWDQWSKAWKATHPVFEEELSGAQAVSRRAKVITQLRDILSDPANIPVETSPNLLAIMNLAVGFQTFMESLESATGAESTEMRNIARQQFYNQAQSLASRDASLATFFNSIVKPLIGEDNLIKFIVRGEVAA